MSKDMKWVKRHRAMLDSWPESGGGPGSGGAAVVDTGGGYNSTGTHCDVTCPMKIDLPLASSIQAKPRPLNLAAAVHCFDWTFLLYASLMHSIKLRVGHH